MRPAVFHAVFLCLAGLLLPNALPAKENWSELNIGPFQVDYDSDAANARRILASLEQLRWILGGMLETKDLRATWPFRVIITRQPPQGAAALIFAHGEYISAIGPNDDAPLSQIARIFIDDNTTRLPEEVDSQLPVLFDGLSARGSKVTWANPPKHPDFAWARVELFATKPEYADRFPVFLNNLRGGSSITVAEANAFGHDSKTLEAEVSAYLSAGNFHPVTTSARPLDPKNDFGEHSFDSALAGLYLADTEVKSNSRWADQAYKSAGEAGYKALAEEGFALLVLAGGGDPSEYLANAISAGSKSAWVYSEAAERRPAADAVALLKTAAGLNPKWWLPPAKLANLTKAPAEKEAFLADACAKNPRSVSLWQQLAELQSEEGKGIAAQNSWIRAEDAATTPEERAEVAQRRSRLENQRLDAEQNAIRAARQAAVADDEKAQNEQMARIRAAEEKANRANAAMSQPEADKPQADTPASSDEDGVMPWWNKGDHPIEASLVRVDCMDKEARIFLRTTSGKMLKLLVSDVSRIPIEGTSNDLGCGIQSPTRRVSVTYKSRVDARFGTAGDVQAIHFE